MKSSRFFLGLILTFLFFPFILFSTQDEELSALIEKGNLLITQKAYPAGIAVLDTVLTKNPKNPKALSLLLRACDEYSQKLIEQNRFPQAQAYLQKMEQVLARMDSIPTREFSSQDLKAKSRIKREVVSAKGFLLSPSATVGTDIVLLNQGRELYNQAVSHFEKRQYDLAESLLKESIALDQSNPYAFELLGEIANLNQKLTEAEAYYKKAFALNPDPRLREKYEKLLREKNIEKSQQHYSDEHFIIRYKRNESIEGSKIRELLREAYRSISQDFGHYPRYQIPVVLYDRKEYEELMGSVPHWSGALYDGKIRLPVYEGVITDLDLRKLIYHELTHAFILDLAKLKCPVWLNEGLAQYEENKIKPIDLRSLANAAQSGRLIALQDLMHQDPAKITSQDDAVLFYLEAFSFVSYVIGKSRFYNMKQCLLELGNAKPFEEAFEKAFGRSFKDFSSEWRKDLEGRYR